MRRPGIAQRIADIAILAGAAAAPFVAESFTLFELTQAMAYGIGVLGLKLLTGYNGQFSLGHSIFFVLGAYAAAILVDAGLSYYLTLPIAAAGAFLLGFALGWPALRIRGHHLAVVTLVLAMALPQIVRSSALAPLTGGPTGLSLPFNLAPSGIDRDLWWYLLTLAAAVAIAGLSRLIVRSRLGRAMQACRDAPSGAEAAGVDLVGTNTLSFGISAAFAGLGGALLMGPLGYVGPDTFTVFLGLSLYVAVIATGPTWILGAFLGGLLIVYLPSWAQGVALGLDKSQSLIFAVYGVILLAILYPQALGRLRFRRRHREAPPETARTEAGP